MGDCFRNDLVSYYGILNKKVFNKAEFKFHCDEDPLTKKQIDFTIKSDKFSNIPEGNTLFKLVARMKIVESVDAKE